MASVRSINVNSMTRVELTQRGNDVLAEYAEHHPEEYLPIEDAEGLYNMNLWEAMKIFGPAMNDYSDPVFVQNSIILIS